MKRLLSLIVCAVILSFGAGAAFEKVNTYNSNFSDVAETSWYAKDVKTAYELGFMNGKSEGKFDPSGNVTVAEGITMISRLHAIYNGKDITSETSVNEYRFDFDTMTGARLNHANGKTENGVLVLQPDKPNAYGNYDPGVVLQNLLIEARRYDKMTLRMKRDILPNTNPDAPRNETLEIYFATDTNPDYSDARSFKPNLKNISDLSEWFEYEIDLGSHNQWSGIISNIRFDPTNNNGIYYIDYIVLTGKGQAENAKWYDTYVDYALKNGLIVKAQYSASDMNRNITRAEICTLIAKALPEEYFPTINNIKGIPDILRDEKNSDVYLALYNAGILLGDTNGKLNPESDIKRSEIAAIIGRVAIPENRVKGEIASDWAKQGNEYDVEFYDVSELSSVTLGKCESTEIVNGALVIKSKDMGENSFPRFDPQVAIENISVPADSFTKLKVRMKAEFVGEIADRKFDFYFKTDKDDKLSEAKSIHEDFVSGSYVDPFGWYVIEIDFSAHKDWHGTITGFRFDPANTNGIYTIDYIRLISQDIMYNASHEVLVNNGYTATRLYQDEGFERGFYVAQFEQKNDLYNGKFQDYCETEEKPLWMIAPWWSKYDLFKERDTSTDKYTIADKYGVNYIRYNPEEKSITMRQNATNIYNGQPHDDTYTWWPHLLLTQEQEFCSFDKARNSAAADRIYAEIDLRMLDFKDTTNTDGTNICQFLTYFYVMTDKAPGQRVWFGMTLFNARGYSDNRAPGWSPDSAAHQYMYGMPMALVYDGMENSFMPEKGVFASGEEWKHLRVDLTPHIDRIVEWANRDNIFGVRITKEDLYFSGVNIGYEIHGNYDCTFEIKNFNLVSYNKQ